MAMRRSIYLVKKNAGEVIVKTGAFILFAILILGIIPGILGIVPVVGVFVAPIYSMVANSIFAWYSICYFVTLYKSLKDKTPAGVTGKGLWIMGVISILGWVVFVLMAGAVASVLPGIIKNMPGPVKYSAPMVDETVWSGEEILE